tara:strand:+ start:316 stop:609 length:294 start_codon:yes stop_codon:yes gene_type:complete
MNKNKITIEGVLEAMRFLRDNWITTIEPVWEGDVHEFMANVMDERVSLFDVIHILKSISNGDHVQELGGVFVSKDYMGKIRRIHVRKEALTKQGKNP